MDKTFIIDLYYNKKLFRVFVKNKLFSKRFYLISEPLYFKISRFLIDLNEIREELKE